MSFDVLLVDDDRIVLGSLKHAFETRCFHVLTAVSAQDAIRMLAHGFFDLIVTDMRMETSTAGFDVVRSAKSKGYNPVVVILSAFPIPPAEWRKSGADAMFMKGDRICPMFDVIRRLLRARRRKKRT
jgi:CheY-like chemotaxis protein